MIGRSRACVLGSFALALVAPTLLARCTTFTPDGSEPDSGESDAGAPVTADSATHDGPDASEGPATLKLVGSRMTLSATNAVDAALPAGVMTGDLIVAFWCARDAYGSQTTTSDKAWNLLGGGDAYYQDDSLYAHGAGFWAGYRLLAGNENDATSYPFAASNTVARSFVTLVAYRRARGAQPVDANVVGTANAPIASGKMVVDLAPLVPTAPAIALYAVCASGDVAFSAVDAGVDRLQATAGFAVYGLGVPLAAGRTASGPRLEAAFSSVHDQTTSNVGAASLAIVSGP